jgi:hypothetical protein
MVEISAEVQLDEIRKKLGPKLESKAPKVLQRAVNKTAKQAQTALFHQAKSVYDVKSSNFKSKSSSLKLIKAKGPATMAHLKSSGSALPLYGFKVKATDDSTKARVKKSSAMKDMHVADRWAFVATMKSGHTSLFMREGKERTPIHEYFSVAVPQMIGNEDEVYAKIEPDMADWLQKNVEFEISRLLRQGGK